MNLLLYAEARQTLDHRRGRLDASSDSPFSIYDPIALPDSLFEELGYFGALAEPAALDAAGWTDWRQWPVEATPRHQWTTRPALPLPTSG